MTEDKNRLTMNDFAFVVNIIDACTERGAFRGNELASIGQLREKFVIFIDSNTSSEDDIENGTENKEDAE